MKRTVRRLFLMMGVGTLLSFLGCGIEIDADQDRPLQITGKVTYHGEPVKQGAIHFLPFDLMNLPASGTIIEGQICDVFTRTQGDGIKPGKYRIAITSFDDDFLKSAATRNALGPDPNEVAKMADKIKKPIPVRYSNSRESGLSAELTQSHHVLTLELVD